MSKIMNFLDRVWESIVYTKIGKAIASLILAVSSFALQDVFDFMFYVGLVFMIYPLGLFCVMMAYAWVINPIRDWKESKKLKELNATELAETFEVPKEVTIIETPAVTITEAPQEIAATETPKEVTPIEIKKTVAKKVAPKKKVATKKASPEKKAVAKKASAKKTTTKKKK